MNHCHNRPDAEAEAKSKADINQNTGHRKNESTDPSPLKFLADYGSNEVPRNYLKCAKSARL